MQRFVRSLQRAEASGEGVSVALGVVTKLGTDSSLAWGCLPRAMYARTIGFDVICGAL